MQRPPSGVVVGGLVGDFPVTVVRQAVDHVLARERKVASIAVSFLGPREMRRLNAEHLGHDRVTDVISFTLIQHDGTVAGDIYVCRAVAARHAREHGRRVREEITRLVVHGVLHVVGWDHPAARGRESSPMWKRQERYVKELG